VRHRLAPSDSKRARRSFSFGYVQGSFARETAVNRLTGADIPEAPGLIVGAANRLPLGEPSVSPRVVGVCVQSYVTLSSTYQVSSQKVTPRKSAATQSIHLTSHVYKNREGNSL